MKKTKAPETITIQIVFEMPAKDGPRLVYNTIEVPPTTPFLHALMMCLSDLARTDAPLLAGTLLSELPLGNAGAFRVSEPTVDSMRDPWGLRDDPRGRAACEVRVYLRGAGVRGQLKGSEDL